MGRPGRAVPLPRRPDDALDLLRLQGGAGNAAICRLLQRGREPAVQRVGERPIPGSTKPSKTVAQIWRFAERYSVVIRYDEGRWQLDRKRTFPNRLAKVQHGGRYVNAFVQPFEAEHQNELWMFVDNHPGAWGEGTGAHTSAQEIDALAAGEAQWTLNDDDTVTLEAVNNRTSKYKLPPTGTAPRQGVDPRVLQSGLLAEQHRLTFHGWNEFAATSYAGDGVQAAEGTTVANLPRGQYLRVRLEVSEDQRAKLARDKITPQEELITYRPTVEEMSAGLPATATLSTAGPESTDPGTTNNNNNYTTTTATTTATTTTTTTTAVAEVDSADPGPPQPAPDLPVGGQLIPVPMAVEDAPPARPKHKDDESEQDDREPKKARSGTEG